jgi:asparagine synthase (glutamine-hydrolysing)
MCGITGFIDLAAATPPVDLAQRVEAMALCLLHRGPDEGQSWVDASAGVALGFRRLAIVDVSPAGRQPMASADGRYVICYNGEIYNAEDMRAALGEQGPLWRGHSDTEVLLAAISAWGLEAALSRTIGMFAFALWDARYRRLHLVRDRLGKKPLYWTRQNGHLIFGSELGALRAHPAFKGDIDPHALAGYMRTGYVLHPRSIYAGVHQMPPGHMLSFVSGDPDPVPRSWWSLEDTVAQAQLTPFRGSDAEALDSLQSILGDAVRRRMVADVPLGAFLSGGYDSSAIVALMQRHATARVRTFSIGFRESAYDESVHARAVAHHLGTDHTELMVTPEDAQAVIPRLGDIYDEPFADSSGLPTFLVSALAREQVTVALSGDGGDEVFAGYNRYQTGAKFARWAAPLPRWPRALAGQTLAMLSPEVWDRLFEAVPERLRPRAAGNKMHKLAAIAGKTPDGFYRTLTGVWPGGEMIIPSGTEDPLPSLGAAGSKLSFSGRMQMFDTLTYLPGDILTKVDRASMAVSLEARCPLLDHRVIAFAWSLPETMKLRGSQSKWLLRQLVHRFIPQQLVDRPKAGFAVPIGDWLRGPLRDWAEDLLSPASLMTSGLLDVKPVRRCWDDHLAGRRNGEHALWAVLMFEAWRRKHPF